MSIRVYNTSQSAVVIDSQGHRLDGHCHGYTPESDPVAERLLKSGVLRIIKPAQQPVPEPEEQLEEETEQQVDPEPEMEQEQPAAATKTKRSITKKGSTR